MSFKFTEDEKSDLTLKLAELDENYICFGSIFAEVTDIVDVVESYLDENIKLRRID